jgi:AcrR family transcriptional regulator
MIMEYASDSVEEKIITATIECLEKNGVQGTTNRKIAEIAGINSAAINYYFRSKEILVQHAMEKTLANAFDWKDIATLPGNTPQEHCAAIFINLVEGAVNYPGITRAHFYDLLSTGNYNTLIVKRMNEFIMHLGADLQERELHMEKHALENACMQITSAVFFFILSPKLFQSSFGLDMTDPVQSSAFITQLVNQLLR